METSIPAIRYVDAVLAIIGAALAFMRGLGYLFFASSLSFSVFVPALVLGMLSCIPLSSFRENRWLVFGLLGLYLASYLLGGLDRLVQERTVMPDLIEFSLVAYSSFRAVQSRRGDILSNKGT